MEHKNYGFVPSVIDSTQYILGGTGLPKTILQPDGNWEQYLPKYEPQYENYETYGCTVWGTQNALETLIKRLYSYEPNYSERYNYIITQVRAPGADPHKIAESIRKDGVIDNTLLGWTPTYEEFILPYPMTKELITKGEEWLNKYDFGHEWIFTNNPDKQTRLMLIKEALQYSPVCLSVSAWASDANDLYYAYNNAPNNHWVECYKIEGESLWIFDSYDQSKKKLHPDHSIQMAKRYFVGPSTRQEKLSWIQMMLNWIAEQLGLIQTQLSQPTVTPPAKPVESPVATSLYDWTSKESTIHSCRVIMDEFNLSWNEKNLLCAVIMAESGMNTKAKNVNKNKSIDWGICQINDAYWIGKDKYFKSVDEVLNKPEKSVRFLVKCYKEGHLNWWYGYKNGSYKKYL